MCADGSPLLYGLILLYDRERIDFECIQLQLVLHGFLAVRGDEGMPLVRRCAIDSSHGVTIRAVYHLAITCAK